MSTFANSEDPDEMQHHAAIGVYTVCKSRNNHLKKNMLSFENYNLTPLDMYNRLSQVYRIKPDGLSISIQRVKGHFYTRIIGK